MEDLLRYAKFIGTKTNCNTFVLEKEFEVKGKALAAYVTATALGTYFIMINGKRVGENYLAPGWTSYNNMLQVQEYDVSSYLDPGLNKIEMVVNVGWYAGRIGSKTTNYYGKSHAGCLELHIDDDTIYYTDLDWKAYTYNIVESSIYDGETIDFSKKKSSLVAEIVPFAKTRLVKQICEPVKTIQIIDVKEVIITPSGDTIYDFGQNVSGVVEITIPEDCKEDIKLRFAENLIDNEFYTDNLRTAKATDIIKHGAGKTVAPEFTIHGFRYLQSSAKLPKQAFRALVRHTNMKRTGMAHSRNDAFNKLMANITWSQRDNFVDVPTNSPQRDERFGWTGDVNAFCRTAAFNFDTRLIIKKWLADLRNDQKPTGEICQVAPCTLEEAYEPSAMWTDAICFVPWTMYEMYGDISFLKDNIEAMKLYINALENRSEKGILSKGQVFGDWLALDNEIGFQDCPYGRTNKLYLGNVFYCEDLRIVYTICDLLGDKEAAKIYQKKYLTVLQKVREEYFNANGRLLYDTITAQVVALHFDIVPEKNKKQLAYELAENVKNHNYRMTTGYIGSTYLLSTLADNGYMNIASKVVMNNEFPSWLYQVNNGATTTWEHFGSIMPDKKPHKYNSFNHYILGSMKEFIYTHVAGFTPIEPGFKSIRIKPYILEGLDSFDAKYLTPYGLIKTSYRQVGDRGLYEFTFPKDINVEVFVNSKNYVFNGKNNTGHFKEEIDLNKVTK